MHVLEAGVYGKSLYLPLNFCNPKTAPKIKTLKFCGGTEILFPLLLVCQGNTTSTVLIQDKHLFPKESFYLSCDAVERILSLKKYR